MCSDAQWDWFSLLLWLLSVCVGELRKTLQCIFKSGATAQPQLIYIAIPQFRESKCCLFFLQKCCSGGKQWPEIAGI